MSTYTMKMKKSIHNLLECKKFSVKISGAQLHYIKYKIYTMFSSNLCLGGLNYYMYYVKLYISFSQQLSSSINPKNPKHLLKLV